jgi:hypothetical protein
LIFDVVNNLMNALQLTTNELERMILSRIPAEYATCWSQMLAWVAYLPVVAIYLRVPLVAHAQFNSTGFLSSMTNRLLLIALFK